MEKLLIAVVAIAGAMALALIVSLLSAYPMMWSWNGSVATMFDVPVIDFWQAFWLNWLSYMVLSNAKATLSTEKK